MPAEASANTKTDAMGREADILPYSPCNQYAGASEISFGRLDVFTIAFRIGNRTRFEKKLISGEHLTFLSGGSSPPKKE